jgi:hypothetical protein
MKKKYLNSQSQHIHHSLNCNCLKKDHCTTLQFGHFLIKLICKTVDNYLSKSNIVERRYSK